MPITGLPVFSMPLDLTILKFINVTIANPAFDIFFGNIGDFRLWALPILAAVILLLWKGGPRGRWLVAIALITVILVDSSIHLIIKPLFARPRPCHAEPAITWLRLIAGCGGKYGFPSSHAANTFSQAVVVGAFYKRSRLYMLIFAVLVSISRVYLGAHYPLDVFAGAIYGAIIGSLVFYLAKALAPKKFAICFITPSIPEKGD
jgi:undecaprenyl-diphosphatase